MPNSCSQVNIPEIDNTAIECDDIILSTCITVKQICTKVGNLEGETLDKFIERLCFKIAKMDNAIYTLTQRIKILEDQAAEQNIQQ